MNLSRDDADTKIKDLMNGADIDTLSEETQNEIEILRFADIESMTVDQIVKAREDLDSIIRIGKTGRRIFLEDQKLRRTNDSDTTIKLLTGLQEKAYKRGDSYRS